MSTQRTDFPTHGAATLEKPSIAAWPWFLLALVLIGVIAYFARYGAVSPRIANPDVTGVPRPDTGLQPAVTLDLRSTPQTV